MAYQRQPFVAGQFYPARDSDCRGELERYTQCETGAVAFEGVPRAGIVPHAGWVYSGATAGKVFRFFKDHAGPEVFILLGAMHRAATRNPVIMSDGAWETPLGSVSVDQDVAAELESKSETPVVNDARLHDGEHSIEVQIPFIQFLFPQARIVPVLMPPGEAAVPFGRAVGEIVAASQGRVVAVASTDLTHYGFQYGFAPKGEGEDALRWVRDVNDKRFIDAAISLDGDKLLDDAAQYRNACGAGAAAAAVTAARCAGRTRGVLLEYTTSHDVMPRGAPTLFVGYAGLIF